MSSARALGWDVRRTAERVEQHVQTRRKGKPCREEAVSVTAKGVPTNTTRRGGAVETARAAAVGRAAFTACAKPSVGNGRRHLRTGACGGATAAGAGWGSAVGSSTCGGSGSGAVCRHSVWPQRDHPFPVAAKGWEVEKVRVTAPHAHLTTYSIQHRCRHRVMPFMHCSVFQNRTQAAHTGHGYERCSACTLACASS